jgi:type IV pilus assembly protein PilO
MTLDDLNKLNIKDVANWPVLPKLGALAIVLAAILFAGYWFDWSSQLSELDSARQEEAKLRDSFLNKKKQAINLDTYKSQLKEIEQSFGALLKQLPNKSEMDALLTDINQAGLGRGLQFELFKPAATETPSEFYAELPITIRLTGSYHDLGAFVSDVSQLSRIVTLNEVSINSGKDGLVMDAVAKTFRYLDEDEVAAQKKSKDAKDKGKPKDAKDKEKKK